MSLHVTVSELMEYTAWEREKWQAMFRQRGNDGLQVSTGAHGDGRFKTIGELIRHIFSAEKRYVERLTGRPLSDTASVPADQADRLFDLGRESRAELQQLVDSFPESQWESPVEFPLMSSIVRATPRKVVIHVLTHEMRHWGQVATLLRLQGITDGFRDFLLSPVLGGELRKA